MQYYSLCLCFGMVYFYSQCAQCIKHGKWRSVFWILNPVNRFCIRSIRWINSDLYCWPFQANPDPSTCLGVFGLSLYTTERDLREVFSRYGPLAGVNVVYDQRTGRSRGFAFVYFERLEDSKEVRENVCGFIYCEDSQLSSVLVAETHLFLSFGVVNCIHLVFKVKYSLIRWLWSGMAVGSEK